MIELRGVSKTVPSGTGQLTILHPLDLTIERGRVVAITGPSGQREIDAARVDRRARCAVRRAHRPRRRGHYDARRGRAGAPPRRSGRDRVPVLSPAAVADGVRERARYRWRSPAFATRTRARGRCCRRSASASERTTIHHSCRAASSSASRLPARSPTILRSCSRTSRPEIWTARPDGRSSICCSRSTAIAGTTLVLVTHDPDLARVADMSVALRDGRVVRAVEPRVVAAHP